MLKSSIAAGRQTSEGDGSDFGQLGGEASFCKAQIVVFECHFRGGSPDSFMHLWSVKGDGHLVCKCGNVLALAP